MNESQTARTALRASRLGERAGSLAALRFSGSCAPLRSSGHGRDASGASGESRRLVRQAPGEGLSVAGLAEVGRSLRKMRVTTPNKALERMAAQPFRLVAWSVFIAFACRLSEASAAIAQLGR